MCVCVRECVCVCVYAFVGAHACVCVCVCVQLLKQHTLFLKYTLCVYLIWSTVLFKLLSSVEGSHFSLFCPQCFACFCYFELFDDSCGIMVSTDLLKLFTQGVVISYQSTIV